MTRPELVELLDSLEIPVNEGTPSDKNIEAIEVVYFWDYLWEPLTASGKEYNTNVTYQISFLAEKPRSPRLLELKHKLSKLDLFPPIQHEYDPRFPRGFRCNPSQETIVLALAIDDILAQEEYRFIQEHIVLQIQDIEDSTGATVPVKEWMYGFELIVHDGHLDERVRLIVCEDVLHQVVHQTSDIAARRRRV